MAPQGIGAMITMPIAGTLADRLPIGRITPVGIAVIVIGLFGFTQVGANTPIPLIVAMLFVMGLGMGATMMPLFTAALKVLRHSEAARGSTLLNITQQIASSCGVAVMSVLLTNHLNSSPTIPGTSGLPGLGAGGLNHARAGIFSQTDPQRFAAINQHLHLSPGLIRSGLDDAAAAFAHTYWVAWVLVALTLVPAFLLPRRHDQEIVPEEEDADEAPRFPVV